MKLPEYYAIPAWYELDVAGEKEEALVIRIHHEAISALKKITSDAPIVLHYRRSLHLSEFVESMHDCWGFEKVFRKHPYAQNGWTEYRIVLPSRGKMGLAALYPIRASLSVIFTALWLFRGDTKQHLPQLMVVDNMCVVADMNGGSMNVVLTPALIEFLSKQGNGHDLVSVTDVMRKTYTRISGDIRYPFGGFSAFCEPTARLHLSVPGDACGLDPDSYVSFSLGGGYKLSSHNIDSGLQQLSLLMGLAKLHSLVRGGL